MLDGLLGLSLGFRPHNFSEGFNVPSSHVEMNHIEDIRHYNFYSHQRTPCTRQLFGWDVYISQDPGVEWFGITAGDSKDSLQRC